MIFLKKNSEILSLQNFLQRNCSKNSAFQNFTIWKIVIQKIVAKFSISKRVRVENITLKTGYSILKIEIFLVTTRFANFGMITSCEYKNKKIYEIWRILGRLRYLKINIKNWWKIHQDICRFCGISYLVQLGRITRAWNFQIRRSRRFDTRILSSTRFFCT